MCFFYLQSLYSRVKEEQKKYLECAKESWPDFRDRTKKTRGDAHNYFLQYWMVSASYVDF